MGKRFIDGKRCDRFEILSISILFDRKLRQAMDILGKALATNVIAEPFQPSVFIQKVTHVVHFLQKFRRI